MKYACQRFKMRQNNQNLENHTEIVHQILFHTIQCVQFVAQFLNHACWPCKQCRQKTKAKHKREAASRPTPVRPPEGELGTGLEIWNPSIIIVIVRCEALATNFGGLVLGCIKVYFASNTRFATFSFYKAYALLHL